MNRPRGFRQDSRAEVLQTLLGFAARLVLPLLCLSVCLSGRLAAEVVASKEYQVKAAFLINFIRFADWPGSALPTSQTPIRIGILGDDPFGSTLEDTVHDEMVHNHPLAVIRSQRLDDLKDCQLLFICKSEKDHVEDIVSGLSLRAVLVVSDIDQFADRGGMIGFFLERKKIRFEINPKSIQKQNIKMSSQLLSLGKIVDRDGDKGHQ